VLVHTNIEMNANYIEICKAKLILSKFQHTHISKTPYTLLLIKKIQQSPTDHHTALQINVRTQSIPLRVSYQVRQPYKSHNMAD